MITCVICEQPQAKVLGPIDGWDGDAIQCPRCGEYQKDRLFTGQEIEPSERPLVVAALRQASMRGDRRRVTTAAIPALIGNVRFPSSALEGVDRVLRELEKRSASYGARVSLDPTVDYPLVVAKNAGECAAFFRFAEELGYYYLSAQAISLRGWQRISALQTTMAKSRQAFVAMWFDPSLDAVWEHGFRRGIEATGRFDPVRADLVQHNDRIDDWIIATIRQSGLLVADFTGNRAGVYFEAGLAMGLGIPVIWTCKEDRIREVHFDTRQYNHILWTTPEDLCEKLRLRIVASVPASETVQEVREAVWV